jgi:hypothetical protein
MLAPHVDRDISGARPPDVPGEGDPPLRHGSPRRSRALGFTINPKLTPLVEKRGEQVTVSEERRSVYMDATLSGASYFMTPLSFKYTLDRLAPQLEDALAGRAPQRMIETSD